MQELLEDLSRTLKDSLFLDLDEFGLVSGDDGLSSRFIGIILDSTFQPIWKAREEKSLLGYEALLRPSIGSGATDARFAFDFADKRGQLVQLDRVARTLHMLNFLKLPGEGLRLFLNVHEKLLAKVSAHGKVFEQVLHAHSVPTRQVVIEIQEHAVEADRHVLEPAANYRDRHYQVAFDGVFGKATNLARLFKAAPEFVKFDRSLIRQAAEDKAARAALPHLVRMVRDIGAKTIVQGIETPTQLEIANDSGADYVQGYWLGRPQTVGTLTQGENAARI